MPKIGTLIIITYPEYAVGIKGRIQAQEHSGRWIVKLETNPLPINTPDEVILLSLEESDFQVIETPD